MNHFSKRFRKNCAKLPAAVQHKLSERLELFEQDPFHPALKNHALGGEYEGCRSINVTGNYRAIYYEQNGVYFFLRVGTHPELYG
jgi:addiction module RelE/StbE family toxin